MNELTGTRRASKPILNRDKDSSDIKVGLKNKFHKDYDHSRDDELRAKWLETNTITIIKHEEPELKTTTSYELQKRIDKAKLVLELKRDARFENRSKCILESMDETRVNYGSIL